jgi:hypothetical protein
LFRGGGGNGMKLYVVEIQYGYESSSVYGVFDSKEEAEKHKTILKEDEDELGILDGVVIFEQILNKPSWDVTSEEVTE